MLKWLGIILIGICAVTASVKTVERGKIQLEIYEALISFVMELRDGMICLRLPLCELYSRCAITPLTSRGFTEMLGEYGWADSLRMSGIADILDERSLSAVCEFGALLGKSGVEEQEVACDYCISRLKESFEKIRSDNPGRSKMFSSLCLIGGFALIIVLI